jgi:hypothetical protein
MNVGRGGLIYIFDMRVNNKLGRWLYILLIEKWEKKFYIL